MLSARAGLAPSPAATARARPAAIRDPSAPWNRQVPVRSGNYEPWPIAQQILLVAYVAALAQICAMPLVDRWEMSPAKYLPIGIALVAQITHLLTCRQALPQLFAIIRHHWAIFALTLLIFGGSLYASFVRDQDVTFRAQSLSFLAFFPTCHLALASDPRRFARMLIVLLTFASFYMFGIAWAFFPRQMVHETVYLCAATVVFAGLVTRSTTVRWLSYVFMGLFAVVGLKNTTFIIAGVGIYCLYVFNRPSVRLGLIKPLRVETMALLGLLGSIGYFALHVVKQSIPNFSDGNADFRTHLYAKKWQMFLDSPIWGDLFSNTPNVQFDLFLVGGGQQFLPAHSDLLDILANGGLIAAALFCIFVYRVLREGLRGCVERSGGPGGQSPTQPTASSPTEPIMEHSVPAQAGCDRITYAARACLFAICVSALIQCAFNPVLSNPPNGFMFWSCFGLFAALSWGERRPALATGEAKHPPGTTAEQPGRNMRWNWPIANRPSRDLGTAGRQAVEQGGNRG